MEPFSLERCCYQLTLTIFERQVTLATDSPRIHELLSHAFGSRYFAGRGGPERTFYCSVACDEPWDMVMGFPDGIFLSRASKETPSSYDLFRWSPEGVVPAGFYSYHKSPDLSLVPTDLEIFASHFQREVLEHLLKDEPSLRLIHGGAIAHGGCGLLLLGPTKGGKSTLTLACVLSGMKFLSDDHIPFDLTLGEMHPFPRMLRLRTGTCEMLPDFEAVCTNKELDPLGELRSFVHPENLRNDALGKRVRLTHVFHLKGFAAQPMIIPTPPAEMAVNCTVADFFAPKERSLDLVWQWGAILHSVTCAELLVGHPKETAQALTQYVEQGQAR